MSEKSGEACWVGHCAVVPPGYPIGVVVANREYEAWFIAAFPSSRFRAGLIGLGFNLSRRSLPARQNVEEVADCNALCAA